MTVQHSAITEAQGIHEPKGVSTASSGQVYIADGAGSGDWRYLPHSHCYYDAIGTGTTYTAPTAYTLINPTTAADSAPHAFTHNSAGRLTYTGTDTIDVTVEVSSTFKHSSATLVDIFFKLYKNGTGVTGTEAAMAALSGNYTHTTLRGHFSMATNDYVEVYCKTASGNVVIHAISLSALGHP